MKINFLDGNADAKKSCRGRHSKGSLKIKGNTTKQLKMMWYTRKTPRKTFGREQWTLNERTIMAGEDLTILAQSMMK